jgi:HlyD family secretion protein
MRRLLSWLVILGVIGGVAAAVSVPVKAWWQQRSVPRYLTVKVSRGRVETVVNSTGTVKPVHTVSVGAFASGPIEKVLVDYNSKVAGPRPGKVALPVLGASTAGLLGSPCGQGPLLAASALFPGRAVGQLLAVIDKKLAQAALDRDQAAMRTQVAEKSRVTTLRDQAKNNALRAHELTRINKDYLSKTDMEQYDITVETSEAQVALAAANVAQAEANVALAKANLSNSQANLDYTNIFSPVDGIVIERKVDPGQTVAASFQTPELFIIAEDMDKRMHVFASVDEADIGMIRAAQQGDRDVKFTVDAYPGELFAGKIYQVRNNSTTTQNVVTYPVVIEAPNPDMKLMPGMTASLSFQIEAKDNVLRVPAAALRFVPLLAQVRPEDRHYLEAGPAEGGAKRSASEKVERSRGRQRRVVWVQDGDLLRAVPVKLGLIENQFAELLEGDLTEDQAVVTGTESPLAPR